MMRQADREAHVVMLQEAFTPVSKHVWEVSGYANIVTGPVKKAPSARLEKSEEPEFIKARSFWKGEKLGKWMNSGLAIMSDFPITEVYRQPFRRRACAGFDCGSNKGFLLVAIEIPGLPEPVEFLTTHMNSRYSSGVSMERAAVAHRLQATEIQQYLIKEIPDDGRALIAGGDFNTRNDRDLLDNLVKSQMSSVVRYYCLAKESDCTVLSSYDGDEPWLDTPDLQVFYSGKRIKVRPIEIEALFDEPVEGRMLSDHDAYMVTYRLTW